MISGDFAAIAVALSAAHHVGDYWVQRDVDAQHKADPGHAGRLHCLVHVLTYVATQMFFLAPLPWMVHFTAPGVLAGLAVSGVTHYIADRRAPLQRIASWIPGKVEFLKLGRLRTPQTEEVWSPCPACDGRGTSYDESTGGKCWDCRGGGLLPGYIVIKDSPQLATGLWALDQSWHIFWGVFVAALLMVTL